MKHAAVVALGAALAVAAALPSSAQTAGTPPVETQASVSYQFERVGMNVPRYTIMVHENGTGSYQADPAGAVSSGGRTRFLSFSYSSRSSHRFLCGGW